MKKWIIALTILFSVDAAMAAWGAIAYDPQTQRYGAAWGWSTQTQAQNTALNYCAATYCRIVTVGYNTWLTLAVSKSNKNWWGTGKSSNQYESLYLALYNCNLSTYACRVWTSFYSQ